MKTLTIAPNKPVTVALVNPEGVFDFEIGIGFYETTAGQTFSLPRPAVILLNELDPAPGEEIVITKIWSGRPGDKARWTIALSTRSELARRDDSEAMTLTEQLEASLSTPKTQNAIVGPPTPITRPAKREPKPEVQPRLFDRRGTGTDGPAPATLPAARRTPEAIPWNVAFREVSAWVAKELAANGLQWSDEAQQAMVCTCLIAEVKAGRIATWERKA